MKYDRQETLEKIQPFLLLYPTEVEYCVNTVPGGMQQLCIFYKEMLNNEHQKMWIKWLNSVGINHQWTYGSFLTIELHEDEYIRKLQITNGGPYHNAL